MSGVSVARKGVCLVAGAGPGIGQSVAKRFAKGGFTVVAVRRKQDQLEPIVAQINQSELPGYCVGFGCDVRKEEDVIKLVDKVIV